MIANLVLMEQFFLVDRASVHTAELVVVTKKVLMMQKLVVMVSNSEMPVQVFLLVS